MPPFERVVDLLQPQRLGAAGDAVVECPEVNALLAQLALCGLMSVQARPCGVGKIPGELDEQWTEVLVDDVEVGNQDGYNSRTSA